MSIWNYQLSVGEMIVYLFFTGQMFWIVICLIGVALYIVMVSDSLLRLSQHVVIALDLFVVRLG